MARHGVIGASEPELWDNLMDLDQRLFVARQ